MRSVGILGLAGAALAALATSPGVGAEHELAAHRHHAGRTRYPVGYKPRKGGSIADRPHEHKREIARRQRQAERVAENRAARLARYRSKRGSVAPPGAEQPQGMTRGGRFV